MEAVQLAAVRPDPTEVEKEIEEIRKDAEAKIAVMINKATALYYKDNNSVATIEEGIEVVLVQSKRSKATTTQQLLNLT